MLKPTRRNFKLSFLRVWTAATVVFILFAVFRTPSREVMAGFVAIQFAVVATVFPVLIGDAFTRPTGDEHIGVTLGTGILFFIWLTFALLRYDAKTCDVPTALHQSFVTLLNAPDGSVCVDQGWLLLAGDVEHLFGVVMFGVFLALVLRFFETPPKRREIKKG